MAVNFWTIVCLVWTRGDCYLWIILVAYFDK